MKTIAKNPYSDFDQNIFNAKNLVPLKTFKIGRRLKLESFKGYNVFPMVLIVDGNSEHVAQV